MQPESDYEETTTQAQVKEYSLKQLVCPFQNYHCHKKKKKRTDKDWGIRLKHSKWYHKRVMSDSELDPGPEKKNVISDIIVTVAEIWI